jgi:type I restriction enzyme S subunit
MWNFRAINSKEQPFLNQSLKLLISQHSKSSTGSAREFFRKDYFYQIPIILPQENVLLSFANLSEEITLKIDLNIRQIQTLTKTRDVLLPKLMSGKLRIQKGLHE